MNWVGGARSRIKLQEQKKRQKEYFARKKFYQKVVNAKDTPRSGKGMSQDLMSLQTIAKAHHCRSQENAQGVHNNKINVRMVDLEKITSASKFPKEIDLGPISPPQRTLKDNPGISLCESSSLFKRDFLPSSEKVESFERKQAPMSTGMNGQKQATETEIRENNVKLNRQSTLLYAPPSGKNSTSPSYSSTATSGLETPYNRFSRPPGHSKVTFSNIITTRIQTPSPAVHDSGAFSKPFMRGKSSDPVKPKSLHKPFWEQDSPLLVQADEAPKHLHGKLDLWSSLQKHSEENKKQKKSVEASKSSMEASSKPLTEKSFCKEFNQKRELAYLSEDFQVTPLKKYITKEDYQLRKQKEKQRKQLKREHQRIEREKKEVNKLEELKKQNSLWSILDDSFYNKVEPCGNKNATGEDNQDRHSCTETTLPVDRSINLDSCVDDAKYNKVVTNSSLSLQQHQPRTDDDKSKGYSTDKKESHNERGSVKKTPFWEIVNDVYYNQKVQGGQKHSVACDTQEKKRRVDETPRNKSQVTSGKKDLETNQENIQERSINVSEITRTPCNLKIPSLMKNPPDSQTARSLNWLAFISGKPNIGGGSVLTPDKCSDDLQKPPEKLSLQSDKKTTEIEELAASPKCQAIPQTVEKQKNTSSGVILKDADGTEEEWVHEDANVANDKLYKEDPMEIAHVTMARDLLQELLKFVCDKAETISNSSELPATEVKIPDIVDSNSRREEAATNTEIVESVNSETQTDEATTQEKDSKTKPTKNAASECHILKDFPTTVNRFTQTGVEDFIKRQTISTQTPACGTEGNHEGKTDGTNISNIQKTAETTEQQSMEIDKPPEKRETQPTSSNSVASVVYEKDELSNPVDEEINKSDRKAEQNECPVPGILKHPYNEVLHVEAGATTSDELVENSSSKSDQCLRLDKRDQRSNNEQEKMDSGETQSLQDWIGHAFIERLLTKVSNMSRTFKQTHVTPLTETSIVNLQVESNKEALNNTHTEHNPIIEDRTVNLKKWENTKEVLKTLQTDNRQISEESNVNFQVLESMKEVLTKFQTDDSHITEDNNPDLHLQSNKKGFSAVKIIQTPTTIEGTAELDEEKSNNKAPILNLGIGKTEKVCDNSLQQDCSQSDARPTDLRCENNENTVPEAVVVRDSGEKTLDSITPNLTEDCASGQATQLSELLFSQSSEEDQMKLYQDDLRSQDSSTTRDKPLSTTDSTYQDSTGTRYNLRSKSKA